MGREKKVYEGILGLNYLGVARPGRKIQVQLVEDVLGGHYLLTEMNLPSKCGQKDFSLM